MYSIPAMFNLSLRLASSKSSCSGLRICVSVPLADNEKEAMIEVEHTEEQGVERANARIRVYERDEVRI